MASDVPSKAASIVTAGQSNAGWAGSLKSIRPVYRMRGSAGDIWPELWAIGVVAGGWEAGGGWEADGSWEAVGLGG